MINMEEMNEWGKGMTYSIVTRRLEHSELKQRCDEDQNPCLRIRASFLIS